MLRRDIADTDVSLVMSFFPSAAFVVGGLNLILRRNTWIALRNRPKNYLRDQFQSGMRICLPSQFRCVGLSVREQTVSGTRSPFPATRAWLSCPPMRCVMSIAAGCTVMAFPLSLAPWLGEHTRHQGKGGLGWNAPAWPRASRVYT
jgi:hypothetical protein